MQKLLYADLSGDTLADTLASAGSNWSWPTLIQGTKLKLGFRLVEEVEGEFVEIDREVTSIRAKIGDLYAQPSSGTYRLHIGPIETAPVEGTNLTTPIAIGASAATVAAAINATTIVGGGGTYGEATVVLEDGSYFVTFAGETAAVPIRGANIRTDVISFIRVWSSEMDGVWTVEIRPDKAGLAFADQIISELPAAPVVSTHRPGVTNEDGTGVNEIQKIAFNPRFRGIYEIHWNDGVTGLLNRDDGPDQVGEALAAIAEEDGEFIVTNPAPNVGMVEFAGSMGAQPQDDLEIVVVDNPPADRYVILDLGTKTAADFLRQAELDDADEIDLPIEVEIRYEDPEDDSRILIWLYQDTVTVRRKLTRDGEATVNDTDYTRPVNGRSYRPFNASQVAAGVHFYPFDLGDGVNDVHTVDHGLGTLLVDVDLRENQPGGAFLIEGTHYTVAYDDEGPGEDAVVITLLGDYAAAAEGSLIGVVVGREQVSHFEEDVTWEIGQINGLLTELNAIKARLSAIEAGNFGGAAPAATVTTGKIDRPLPRVWNILRSRSTDLPADPGPLAAWKPFGEGSTLRDIRLLPAVHLAAGSVEALPPTLPAPHSQYRNRVFYSAVDVPGLLSAGQYAACTGLEWYRVRRESTDETTWYPTAMEMEFFRLTISPDELALRTRLDLAVGIEMALFDPSRRPADRRTVGRMSLILERGVRVVDSTPSATGSNIATHFGSPVILAQHDFDLTEVVTQKRMSLSVARSGDGTLTALASKMMGAAVSAPAPASADFALRLRLGRVDFENLPTDGRGLLAVRGPDVGMDGQADQALGRYGIS